MSRMLSEGATLDRYRIEAELGSGGMGRVFRAFDTRLHRRIALKVLLTPGLDGEERAAAVTKLIREARAAAALNHPNVVGVFDAGEVGGTPYIAMEYVSGKSLARLSGERSVPWEERLRWLVDVARALGAAHHAGLVHRDIKPANVMVRDDGTVKVLDFGIAHFHTPDLARLLTTTGDGLASSDPKIVGTPMYMAPEHLRGDPIDGKADQFSWGVLAYELLSGRLPWHVTGAVSVIGMILSKDPDNLQTIAPELPPEVTSAVMRALQKRPSDRFDSMDDLACQLEPWLAPPMSMPPSLRISGRPLASRRHTPIALSALEPQVSPPASVQPSDGGITPPAVGLTNTSQSISVPPPSVGSVRSEASYGVGKDDGSPRSNSPRSGQAAPSKRRWPIAVGVAFVALSAALIALLGRDPPPAPDIAAHVFLPSPTTLADLPRPDACGVEAAAAYADGLRLLREGNEEQASGRFQSAADVDPGCAAAQVRVALMGTYFFTSARVAEAYKQALKLRKNLSERDQGLLDAFEPMRLRDPPDRSELSARLLKLAQRFPMDAEILVLAASESRASPDARLGLAKRAADIDPQYADAFQSMGQLLALTGAEAEALSVLEGCARVAPLSTDCLWQRSEIFRAAGRCGDLEADARRIIARSPGTSLGYAMLAEALASRGSAPESLREVLKKRWERLREPDQRMEQAVDEAAMAVLGGAFHAAEERARELDKLAQETDELAHRARSLRYLAECREEVGADVAPIAGEFGRRKQAWGRRVDVFSSKLRGHFYDELRLLDLARGAGQLSDEAWSREVERFRDASTSLFKLDERLVWTVSSAMPVRTAEEARRALDAFPGGARLWSGPPERFERAAFPHIFTGRALHVAGRDREAAAYLRQGVSACNVLEDPFLNTRAHLWLGQALERAGERAEACAAYGVVLSRWGHAKPPSKTAEAAAERVKKLACDGSELRLNKY